MSTPVIVGVLLALMFLVAFSQWFVNLMMGMNEAVLDDKYFHYRIIGASLLTLLLFVGSFVGIATVMECPGTETKEGVFANLACEQYLTVKTASDELFQKINKTTDKPLDEPTTLPSLRESTPTPQPTIIF